MDSKSCGGKKNPLAVVGGGLDQLGDGSWSHESQAESWIMGLESAGQAQATTL